MQPKKKPEQQSLFVQKPMKEHGLARRTDPETSKAAAKSIEVGPVENLFIETVAKTIYGLTSNQVCAITGLQQNTINPRSAPLVRKGFLYDSGLRHQADNGRWAIVWRIVGKSYPSDEESIKLGGLNKKEKPCTTSSSSSSA